MTGCPCCDDADTAEDWYSLCDTCLSAWLAGVFPHGCERPKLKDGDTA